VAARNDGRGAVTDRDLNVHANRRYARQLMGDRAVGDPCRTGRSGNPDVVHDGTQAIGLAGRVWNMFVTNLLVTNMFV
jgi:hypothetical protein